MDIDIVFPSKYLKGTDIPSGVMITLTIDHVTIENMGGFSGSDDPDDNKLVLYFAGKTRGLVLNMTNRQLLRDTFGKETDNWVGHQIQLYATPTQYKKQMVQGLRIAIPKPARPPQQPATAPPPPPPPPPPAAPPEDANFVGSPADDDIPF